MHYSDGTLNQNSLVYRKYNGKNRLSMGQPRLFSNFPFVNLQMKSIVESLRPIKLCTQ